MKTIGIIGGLAWPSTITYYRIINEYYSEYTGKHDGSCPKLVIAQTDFLPIKDAQTSGDVQQVGAIVAAEANKLKASGADFFLIACNTVHSADSHITAATDLPLLHIVDVTGAAVKKQGITKVALIGSIFTMEGSYFVDRLRDNFGVQALVPDAPQQTGIHTRLAEELSRNIILPETKQYFLDVIKTLVDRGAEALILGCTEFGMLISQADSPVPLFDTGILHARAAVEMAFRE